MEQAAERSAIRGKPGNAANTAERGADYATYTDRK
jgi:hypothetical protein